MDTNCTPLLIQHAMCQNDQPSGGSLIEMLRHLAKTELGSNKGSLKKLFYAEYPQNDIFNNFIKVK